MSVRLVARGEGRALFAAAAAHFCLLAGYYMLRSLREAMALEAGRALIPTLFTVTFVVMLVILPAYWWLVGRLPRHWLLPALYVFVVALFLALAAGFVLPTEHRLLAAVYFVAVTSLNLFMVSVFWSTMADRWAPAAAQRLFGYIAAGGSAGALAGPAFNVLFVERLGPSAVIVIACGLLAVTIVAARLAQSGRDTGGDRAATAAQAVGGRARDDLARLVRSPYLLTIAGLIVAGQVIGAFMYNEQARFVEVAYADVGARAALFARIDFAVNVLSLLTQGLVVGWLTTRASLRVSLSAMPVVVGVSFVALALVPTMAVLLATQVVRRAADYGLAKPTREMLFTVLNPESKFKSKSLIDTVLQRGADTLGNWLYVAVAGLGLAGLAWLSAALCAALVGVTSWLGGAFRRRADSTA
jgi:AAA family ATP:ADP antiporter